MFQSIKTWLMILTIIMLTVTIITNPVFNTAAAQEQQYSFVTKWGSDIWHRFC
jgi:hypothetical protein